MRTVEWYNPLGIACDSGIAGLVGGLSEFGKHWAAVIRVDEYGDELAIAFAAKRYKALDPYLLGELLAYGVILFVLFRITFRRMRVSGLWVKEIGREAGGIHHSFRNETGTAMGNIELIGDSDCDQEELKRELQVWIILVGELLKAQTIGLKNIQVTGKRRQENVDVAEVAQKHCSKEEYDGPDKLWVRCEAPFFPAAIGNLVRNAHRHGGGMHRLSLVRKELRWVIVEVFNCDKVERPEGERGEVGEWLESKFSGGREGLLSTREAAQRHGGKVELIVDRASGRRPAIIGARIEIPYKRPSA